MSINYGVAWDDYIRKTDIWNVQVCNSDQKKHSKWALSVVERVRPFVNKESVVVDIGCGTGGFCNRIAPHVKKILGIDVSSVMVDHVRRTKANKNIFVVQIEEVDIPLPDDSVDLVNSTLTFQHIILKDFKKYVEESYRVLKVGGVLHFQVWAAERGMKISIAPIIQNQSYTADWVREMVLSAGFKDVSIKKENIYLWVKAVKELDHGTG